MRYPSLAVRLRHSAALGVLAAALAMPAFAQQATDQPPATVETVAPAEQPADQGSDRVVVTGSRLAQQFESASPMTVIVADDAAVQGIADVASLLRNSTVASGSPQITAVTSTAFVENGGTGAESISLRGLGSNRTLVLLDGRRAGPAGTRGSVSAFDFNVIPLSAISRVEILKDGASSIYGSDAVAGVVNIITKKGTGVDFDLFASKPGDEGGEQIRANASWGQDFGQGNFRITADYFKQEELARGQRDFFACAQPYVFFPGNVRADLVDPRTGEMACSSDLPWGHVWFYDYGQPGAVARPWQARPQLIQFDYDNNLGNYLPGFEPGNAPLNLPAGWFPVGYGEINGPTATPDPFYQPSALISDALVNVHSPFQDVQSLSPEVERTTIFGSGEYNFNNDLSVYGEVLLNRRVTKTNSYRQFWTYQYVYDYGYGNYVGDPTAIAQGWTGPNIGFSPTAITDHNSSTTTVDYMRFVAGAKGNLLSTGWTWDASVQFSRSDGEYKEDQIWDDAITPYQFQNSLCAGTTTVYRGIPCVDINWYSPQLLAGNLTQTERDFLFGVSIGNTIYEQTTFEATTTGKLLDLPAGELVAAFGVNYQVDRINDVPDQLIQDGQAWGSSQSGITKGRDKTSALFMEFGVPILKDAPFAKSLSLTASGRYTDVDSYGSGETYKLGLNWDITDSLRLRASQGTSFRSPALFEQFLANETGFLGQRAIDPCVNWAGNLLNGSITQRIADNCAADGVPGTHNGAGATATIVSSGSSTLAAETSTSKSIGVVWRPDFINLQASIDYFDIEVNAEVTKLGAGNIVLGCYASLNFATEPLCDLFDRNPGTGSSTDFLITTVTDNFLNIATQTNRGVDVEAIYTHDLPIGELSLSGQVTYQLEDAIQLLPTSAADDFNGRIGDPKLVGNFGATLDTGPWSLYYGFRYVGKTSNVEHFGSQAQTYEFQPVRYVLSTDQFVYHNISASYEFDGGANVRVGITNVLDETPPEVTNISGEYSTVGNVPLVSQYDFMGRTFFLNVTKSF